MPPTSCISNGNVTVPVSVLTSRSAGDPGADPNSSGVVRGHGIKKGQVGERGDAQDD